MLLLSWLTAAAGRGALVVCPAVGKSKGGDAGAWICSKEKRVLAWPAVGFGCWRRRECSGLLLRLELGSVAADGEREKGGCAAAVL